MRVGIQVVAATLAWVGASTSALAQTHTKVECVEANGAGQNLRREGHFAAAEERLRSCADEACPALVRDDCVRRIDELHQVQPSLFFDVVDAAGADVFDVRILMDGTLVAEQPAGMPFKVDPGKHGFTFAVSGQPAITQSVVVREGETLRHVRVVVPVRARPVAPADVRVDVRTQPDTVRSQEDGSGTRTVVGLSLASAGAAGLIVGSAYGVAAAIAWSRSKEKCGGDVTLCSDVQDATPYRNEAQREAIVSTTAFIAGGVLAAGGLLLWLIPRHTRERAAAGVSVAPQLGATNIGLQVGCIF